MKRIAAIVLAAVSFAFAAAEAAKKAPVYFKDVQYAGTGCVAGSAVVAGGDSSTLTIAFSKYDAASPDAKAASKMQRAACSFVMPVHVPQGFQLSGLSAKWRGYAEGQAELSREYFIAGGRGLNKTTSPSGKFTELDQVNGSALLGKCGAGTVPLRINSSLRAAGSGSHIVIGKSKQSGKLSFRLHWKKCSQPGS